MACTPSQAPTRLPVIAAVLSLSPEWLAARQHGCGEVVVMDEGAVDGNGQRLLSDPARAELLDDVR